MGDNFNGFVLQGGFEWEKPRGRLYVAFEQAELLSSDKVSLKFSAVDAVSYDSWFGGYDSRQDPTGLAMSQRLASVPMYLIEFDAPVQVALDLAYLPHPLWWREEEWPPPDRRRGAGALPDAFERLERKWMVFETTEAGGIAARYVGNLFGETHEVRLGFATAATPRESDALDQTDPFLHLRDATDEEIVSAYGRSTVDALAFYDVGQGTAQGLLSNGAVAGYVDFGGGCAFNKGTFPKTTTPFAFCFPSQPNVLLSHWDEDHWSSAGRDPRAYRRQWLAPRPSAGVKTGKIHAAHASAISSNGGVLRLWPSSIASLSVGQLTILKCTGTSRNASGLAIEVGPPPRQPGSPVLMPADAGYDDLPPASRFKTFGSGSIYEAVVCPHHGGASASPSIPGSTGLDPQRLVYSYGPGNTYGHPLHATWPAHDLAGWTDARGGPAGAPAIVRNTEDRTGGLGHVGFDWGTTTAPLLPPACGCGCSLAIVQI